MKSTDRYLAASRAFSLAQAGASHARTAADALARIEKAALALYRDARAELKEVTVQSNLVKIREHVEALKAAAAAGDLAACEEHCAEITAADPGAPEGRRIPVVNVPEALQLGCYRSRVRWYEQRVDQLSRAR